MKLIIVESPTKAKTISKYIGKEFIVLSTAGHIKDLPVSQFGIDIENNFSYKTVVLNGKKKYISKIKTTAKKAVHIFIATDPDREGEAIARHIKEELPLNIPVDRLLFYEITPDAIKISMKNPAKFDNNKFEAQITRRILDRMVGYEISPLLWQKIKRGLSAGRVQTVALKLICDREEERRQFTESEYWTVDFLLEKDSIKFYASINKFNGKKIKITSKDQTEKIVNTIKKKDVKVSDIQIKKRKRNPYPPYITSTLQQDGIRKLGYSAKKTMIIAQQLFEGIEIGKDTIGLITYMRTDSVRVSQDAQKQVKEFLVKTGNEDLIPQKNNQYKDKKKNVQSAHEAIRPTSILRTPEDIKNYLSGDQFKLYKLVWNRFISSQCKPAQEQSTTIFFEANGDSELKNVSTEILFQGYQVFYKDNYKKEEKLILPKLAKNDILKVVDHDSKQHFTSPPPRFTEASLIKELDALGIGRPSTYAPIISKILFRKYVFKDNKNLTPTKLGEIVHQYLNKSFPDVFNVKFTALMEEKLDNIEQGKLIKEEVLSEFYKPLIVKLTEARKNNKPIKINASEKICPICKKEMDLKRSQYGLFLLCPDYPKCKGKKDLLSESTTAKLTSFLCPNCNHKMYQLDGQYGRYLKCSNTEKCNTTTSLPTGVSCPKENCSGKIVERLSKKGKLYFPCDKCDFILWDRPVNKICPSCKYPLLIYKKLKKSSYYLCPECKNKLIEKETGE